MSSHDDHFRRRVSDIKLLDHCRRIRSQEELLDVILDDFVHSKGTVGCLGSVAELSDR